MIELPIRFKLTLSYFAMFAAAACLLSVASWWMLRRSVDFTEYHELHERAEDVLALLANQQPNTDIEELRREFASIYDIRDDGKWLQVVDQQGNWVYRSRRMLAENPTLPDPGHLPAHGLISEFHQGTHYVRTLAFPIQVRGEGYSVQTGASLDRSMTLLKAYDTDLMLITPAVIFLASLGGHYMSRRALRPVAKLADEARRINDRNLDLRLPVSSVEDEISDLSRTLNQMLERIDKAFESVRAFTGNASHELRSPIALLRTEIEVALYRPRHGDDYRETLGRMHEETILMTRLIENLLALARCDGGAEAMILMPIEVNRLFAHIGQTWKDAMQLSLLEFKVEMPERHLIALGDSSSLQRLLSILLENASKYTPPGGTVTLKAESSPEYINFIVHDTGIGISQEDVPRIFDRFYRASQTSDRRSLGSGLGLALGKWIAECHGTQLTVESELGLGSSFSFSLRRPISVPYEPNRVNNLHSQVRS
jgi:signal transduction histidine kinase